MPPPPLRHGLSSIFRQFPRPPEMTDPTSSLWLGQSEIVNPAIKSGESADVMPRRSSLPFGEKGPCCNQDRIGLI